MGSFCFSSTELAVWSSLSLRLLFRYVKRLSTHDSTCVCEVERARRSFQFQIYSAHRVFATHKLLLPAYSFITIIRRIPRANARFMVFANGKKKVFALDVRAAVRQCRR